MVLSDVSITIIAVAFAGISLIIMSILVALLNRQNNKSTTSYTPRNSYSTNYRVRTTSSSPSRNLQITTPTSKPIPSPQQQPTNDQDLYY